MEKEICARHLSREGTGCVWLFMNMFDLKHGGSNHKLLMDKKRGSKRILGIETKVEKQLTCDCEKSVKKLIEEEIDENKCDTKCRGRRSRTCSKASDDDHAEDQYPRTSQGDTDSINDDSEEKFSELIRRLIDQKESEVDSCKNLVDEDDSKEESISQCTQEIVVLKPETNCFGSSPGRHATRNKSKNQRFGSHFILSRISRRFKSSKNPQHDSDQDQDALSSTMSHNSCLEDVLKSEANKEDTIHGNEGSEKSMCGLYIAAKKHLSEMLAEGDMNVDSHDKEVPRLLGKILALPQFSTPENTPRMTLAHDFAGHQITEKPNIQEWSSEDYYEILGLDDLNKHEETTSKSDMPDAYVDEEKHIRPLKTFDERHSQSSPPPSSSVKMCQENATDVPGKSSPDSVLEPFFTDDDTNPNTSRFSSVEMKLKPLCIRFNEPDSPRPEKHNNAKTRMNDKELTLAYIQEVVTSSELNWEEILSRSFYTDQVLEQALMNDIDFCATTFCNDKKLLFDCINEVLMEFCRHGPWISFTKPGEIENAVEVVQEEVYWHLLPLPSPHTLDQIARKDMARSGCWMDLRFDIGCIGSQTGEMILEELLDEIISSFTELF